MAISTPSYTNVVLLTSNFAIAANTTPTSFSESISSQINDPAGIDTFTLTYTPSLTSSVVILSGGVNVDIDTVTGSEVVTTGVILSGVEVTATYTYPASTSYFSTIGAANSAIAYEAGQGDGRFGIGGIEATPASPYEDGSVLYMSGSTYGAQYGVVKSFASGIISFTTVVSAEAGQTATKVQSVPSNSTTPFTFPAKSQNEQLRKRLLGY